MAVVRPAVLLASGVLHKKGAARRAAQGNQWLRPAIPSTFGATRPRGRLLRTRTVQCCPVRERYRRCKTLRNEAGPQGCSQSERLGYSMARIMRGAAEVSKARAVFRKLQRLIGLAESTTLTVLALVLLLCHKRPCDEDPRPSQKKARMGHPRFRVSCVSTPLGPGTRRLVYNWDDTKRREGEASVC